VLLCHIGTQFLRMLAQSMLFKQNDLHLFGLASIYYKLPHENFGTFTLILMLSMLCAGCCICLEQSAGVSTGIAATASFSQQTEDRAFCPVVQLLWLRPSHCTDCHVTSLLFLRVTCPCSLRTHATLKFIRWSSSSSSSTGRASGRKISW